MRAKCISNVHKIAERKSIYKYSPLKKFMLTVNKMKHGAIQSYVFSQMDTSTVSHVRTKFSDILALQLTFWRLMSTIVVVPHR